MGIQLQPSLKALQIERHQLARCRWAFGLFWAGFVVQLLPLFFLAEEPVIPDPEEENRPITVTTVLMQQAVFLVPYMSLTAVGAVLNIIVGRTNRWRQAAWLLLATLLAELVFAVIGLVAMGPSFIPAQGEPLLTRIAFHAVEITLPLSWWWIVVILGEFASACRETILLGQAEKVGYGVLASLAALFMYIGWTLPSPIPSEDDTTLFLKAFSALLQLIVFFWLLFPLSRAYMVSTLLMVRIDEVKRVVIDRQKDESESSE